MFDHDLSKGYIVGIKVMRTSFGRGSIHKGYAPLMVINLQKACDYKINGIINYQSGILK